MGIMTLLTAAPMPSWPPDMPRWKDNVPNRWVAPAGPPLVTTQTSWKSAKVQMVEKAVTTTSKGASSGRVIRRNLVQDDAPSRSAASYRSWLMVWSPANRPMVKKGTPRQTLAAMSDQRAFQGSPRKLMKAKRSYRLNVSSSHRDQSVPNSITQTMWDSNDLTTPKSDDYYYAYHDGHVDYQKLTFEKGIGQTSSIKANVYNRHKEYDYLYTRFTRVDNKTIGGGLEYDLKLGKHSLVVGADVENNDLYKITVKHDSDYNPDWSNLKSKKDLQTDINKYAVYAQDSWKISKNWEAIFGLRWDWAEFDNSGYQYNSAGTTMTDVTGSSRVDGYSPQLNLLYQLNRNFNFYTSIGRAFKIPHTVPALYGQ